MEHSRAEVFIPVWVKGASEQNLKVSLNGRQATFVNSSEDGLLIYRINQSVTRMGMNEIQIDYSSGQQQGEPTLLDAAVFFCRDVTDLELGGLIAMCKPDR